MAAISTKSSRRAIIKEVTEGTPVSPSGGSDFLALQDGFDHGFSFESLENAELKSSIGTAKPILGLETSSPTMSHYLRHSGVEGTAPGYKLLLESLFGSQAIRVTERSTVAGSTVSSINVGVGFGAEFQKGDILLVKDAVNGYSIRAVDSVNVDALSLGFNLSTAPASGVALGRSVMYRPADSGHPTLTVWDYLGNGGAVKMSSGNRVVSGTFTMEAGQLINGEYSMEGISVSFNPVVVTSSNNRLDFNDGAEKNAVIATGVYKDPIEFAAAVQSAMRAVTTDLITVVYSSTTGRYTLTSPGSTFELLFSSGTNTANNAAAILGFAVADYDSALFYTSVNPITLTAPFSPSFDVSDPLVAKSNLLMIGDAVDNICVPASSVSIEVANTKANINSICAASGVSSSLITARSVTASITVQLSQYDADKFHKFSKNQSLRMQYAFGVKTGGNWVAGKCGAFYMPTCVISSFETADQDSYQIVNMELNGFVNDAGEGEIFLGFV